MAYMLKMADIPSIYTNTGPGTPQRPVVDGFKEYIREMLESTNDNNVLTRRYNWLLDVTGGTVNVFIDLAMCNVEVMANVNIGAMHRNPMIHKTYDLSNRMSQGVLDADFAYEAITRFQADLLTHLERGEIGTSHVYGYGADGYATTVCMRCDVQSWSTCFNVPKGNPITLSTLRPYLCLPWLSDGILRDIELDVPPHGQGETPSITPIGADQTALLKPVRQDRCDLTAYRKWIAELRMVQQAQAKTGIRPHRSAPQVPDDEHAAISDWQCLFSWWAINGWINAKWYLEQNQWSVGISELLMINGVSLEQSQDQMDVTTFGGGQQYVPGLISTVLKVEFPADHFHLIVPLPWGVTITRSAERNEHRLNAPAGWWGAYVRDGDLHAADGPTGADPGTLRKRNRNRKQVADR